MHLHANLLLLMLASVLWHHVPLLAVRRCACHRQLTHAAVLPIPAPATAQLQVRMRGALLRVAHSMGWSS